MEAKKEYILSQLEKKGDLPPLPQILGVLEQKINDPDADIYSIAELIESDVVLSGRILKMANSLYFAGGRQKVEDLSEALMRLGMKNTLDLAYSVLIPNLFGKRYQLNQIEFWKHSLGVALLARSMANKLELNEETRSLSYLSGLMHDVGILVFEHLVPKACNKFRNEFKNPKEPLHIIEKRFFGISHPVLGARFIQKWWGLPPALVQAVERSHFPDVAEKEGDELALLNCFANRIANHWAIYNGCDLAPETIKPEDLERWGLSMKSLDQETEKVLETLANAESLLF